LRLETGLHSSAGTTLLRFEPGDETLEHPKGDSLCVQAKRTTRELCGER
jgi:hypothetical protein